VADINTLGSVADVLEKISGQLIKIEGSQKNITSNMPKLLGGMAGGGFSGPGGGSTGNLGSAPGNNMPTASFGGVAGGGGGGLTPAPLFSGSKMGMAALAVGGAAWAVSPDPVGVMNNAARFYSTGLGYSGYNQGAFRDQMRGAMAGGIRNGADVSTATGILNAYGIGPTQGLMGQAATDTATLNRVFNWDTSTSAQMMGQMSGGDWIGNAYRYGMQMSDSKGNPLGLDQQFNTLYNRLWGGRTPTAEGIQNMYRAGGLQGQLSAMGMDQNAQSAFVKFAVNKAGGGTPTVSALDEGNDLNKNPLASQYKVGASETAKMDQATEAIINGYETAAAMIEKINQAYMALPDQATALVEYTRAAAQGLGSNPSSSGLGGVAKGLWSAAGPGMGMYGALRMAGVGGGGGLLGGAASTARGAGSSIIGALRGGAGAAGGAASALGRLSLGSLFALGTFGGIKDTIDMTPERQAAEDEMVRRYAADHGLGKGDGGEMTGMFSGGNIFGSSGSLFDEASALTTFNVHSSAGSAPTTAMGWFLQNSAANSANVGGLGNDLGTAPGTGGGSGKSVEDKRTKPQLHKRGQWVPVATLRLAPGTNWTMGGQVNIDVNSAKGSRRPGWMKTRWVRLGWGGQSNETAAGDVTGVNTFVIPTHLKLHQQLLTPHTIKGGGPVALQIMVEGKGTIMVTLALAKAKAWGRDDSGSSSRGGSAKGSAKGTAGGNDLAGWFESHLGETKNPLTGEGFGGKCLKNVARAVRETGGVFGSNWDSPDQILDRGALEGKLNKGTPPRGALLWWTGNNGTGGGYGHVAVADGKGNFLNNWGGNANVRTPISKAGGSYVGWTDSSALTKNKYSHGAWNIPKDETADIHSGEMILNAQNAELMRNAIREVTGGGGKGGRKVEVNLTITNATDAEAIRFAKKVKALMEEDDMLERMGSR